MTEPVAPREEAARPTVTGTPVPPPVAEPVATPVPPVVPEQPTSLDVPPTLEEEKFNRRPDLDIPDFLVNGN